MQKETTSKYIVTVKEVVQKLGLTGNVLAFGFNTLEKKTNPVDRKITIKILEPKQ